MDTNYPAAAPIEQILSLSKLCAHLHVSAQTIYDLRSQGRGPRGGFRVGRELRVRVSEVEAWLTRLELDDGQRRVSGRPWWLAARARRSARLGPSAPVAAASV